MKPIVKIPDPVLSTSAKAVVSFDKKLDRIIADMKETFIHQNHPKGVGLAAPQIGLPLRIFLTRPTEKDDVRVFVNPTIVSRDPILKEQNKKDHLEGCLSIPNIWGSVKRPAKLTLTYQDQTGKTNSETFTGFLATIIQHEMDHLDGILFTQRVLEQKNKFYQSGVDEKGKEVLEEVVI